MPQQPTLPDRTDIAVIGGGLVGASIAWGLARQGRQVTILDEGDIAHRASRGNFALVWIQSKGLGMPEYSAWSRHSAGLWPAFAAALLRETGLDVRYEQPGGFTLCLSEEEMEARQGRMMRLHNQPGLQPFPWQMLDRAQTREYLPQIGPEVAGASFCPLDGHVNALRLFRALHEGLARHGADYRPETPVETITPQPDGGFLLGSPRGTLRAETIVLAAGLGNARLAPMVGLNVPLRPNKGQIIVTEKARRFLEYPVVSIRQTDEGGVMIGESQEDAGFDTQVTQPVITAMAARAVRMFPALAALNVVRTWSALRVMTADGFPVYDRSPTHPHAYVACCHSGVTLAAAHSLTLAPMIAAGALEPAHVGAFGTGRFDVPQVA